MPTTREKQVARYRAMVAQRDALIIVGPHAVIRPAYCSNPYINERERLLTDRAYSDLIWQLDGRIIRLYNKLWPTTMEG